MVTRHTSLVPRLLCMGEPGNEANTYLTKNWFTLATSGPAMNWVAGLLLATSDFKNSKSLASWGAGTVALKLPYPSGSAVQGEGESSDSWSRRPPYTLETITLQHHSQVPGYDAIPLPMEFCWSNLCDIEWSAPSLASHTLRRERKGLVTLQPSSCCHGRNLLSDLHSL